MRARRPHPGNFRVWPFSPPQRSFLPAAPASRPDRGGSQCAGARGQQRAARCPSPGQGRPRRSAPGGVRGGGGVAVARGLFLKSIRAAWDSSG